MYTKIFRKQLENWKTNSYELIKKNKYICTVWILDDLDKTHCVWVVQWFKSLGASWHIQFNYTKKDFFEKTRPCNFLEIFILRVYWYVWGVKEAYTDHFGYYGNKLCRILNFIDIFLHPKKYDKRLKFK